MKSLASVIIGCLAIFSVTTSVADELVVTQEEITNLGIELSRTRETTSANAMSARAQVVLPPGGEIAVSTSQAGRLVRLHVAVGDEVVAGQVLAEVQSSAFIAQQREFLAAVFDHQLATSQFRRDQQLFDEGIIAKRRLQVTQSKAQTAVAHLNENRQLLRFAGMPDLAIASLADDQRLVETLAIRAPVSAVVTERLADTGESVAALATIYRIADLSTLWLEIQVPQEKLGAIKIGMRAAVEGHDGVSAEIMAIGRSVNRKTQMATVRARLNEDNQRINPGQYLTVHMGMQAESAKPFYSVPLRAVIRSGTKSYVFVRSANGFDVREVSLISTQGDRAYIKHGIGLDARVAITGISALKALWSSQQEPDV